jgi:capsule biosynthesis phosphatase
MKRLVFDLDGTLTEDDPSIDYPNRKPNLAVVERLRAYHALGFSIIISTARNMRTHSNNIGKINAETLPVVISWLERYEIPFDEIHIGKPWCGTDGFYVDDKAIRPSEFVSMEYARIVELLETERNYGVTL